MRRGRWGATVLVSAFAVTLGGCFDDEAARRYDAAMVVLDSVPPGGYRVSAGIGTVLELHAYRVVPMPDAASGYTLLLQLDSVGLLDGQEHSLPMPSVRAFLSVLHAPNLNTTSAVIGTLRLLPGRGGALDARLALSAPAAHWAYTGKAHFRPRPPSCFHRADWYVQLRGRRGCPPISE
jgi:hypothetical protein